MEGRSLLGEKIIVNGAYMDRANAQTFLECLIEKIDTKESSFSSTAAAKALFKVYELDALKDNVLEMIKEVCRVQSPTAEKIASSLEEQFEALSLNAQVDLIDRLNVTLFEKQVWTDLSRKVLRAFIQATKSRKGKSCVGLFENIFYEFCRRAKSPVPDSVFQVIVRTNYTEMQPELQLRKIVSELFAKG